MKSRFLNLTFYSLATLLSSELLATQSGWTSEIPPVQCAKPHFGSDFHLKPGFFHGDLRMECQAEIKTKPLLWDELKKGIATKIQSESEIFSGPTGEAIQKESNLKWDVSHRIEEDGTTVVIREEAELTAKAPQELTYETHSKSVSAPGMAGFLKSVNFSLKVLAPSPKAPNTLEIQFRNEVTVERPWYALEFIFTPIAQGICFDKMEKIRTQLLPWIIGLLTQAPKTPSAKP